MDYNFIPKAQAFKILLQSAVCFTQNTPYGIVPANQTDTNLGTGLISKDDGSFVALTNPAVFVAPGIVTLQLTASEMTADKIYITFANGTNGTNKFSMAAKISTVANELSAAPTITSSLSDKINAVFQYLFLKRTVTATQEKLYKSDDTTVLATGTLSDDSTTFTKGKPA